jgi:ribosomal protein L31E
MDNETLQLLRDLRDQLAVSLCWPGNEKLRSRLRVAIMRAEDEEANRTTANPDAKAP